PSPAPPMSFGSAMASARPPSSSIARPLRPPLVVAEVLYAMVAVPCCPAPVPRMVSLSPVPRVLLRGRQAEVALDPVEPLLHAVEAAVLHRHLRLEMRKLRLQMSHVHFEARHAGLEVADIRLQAIDDAPDVPQMLKHEI